MEDTFESSLQYYSDDELKNIVYQFYDWNEETLKAVQQELFNRGLLPNDIDHKRSLEIAKEDKRLAEGKEATYSQQFLGWIGIVGILGVIIGYELYFSKVKNRITGKEYYKYNEDSRESGRYIYIISLGFIALFIIYKLSNYLERNYSIF